MRFLFATSLVAAAAQGETLAGTPIVNVGQLSYLAAGTTATVASNENRVIVGERLDVTLVVGPMSGIADAKTAATAILTNQGNGQEAFDLVAAVSTGSGQVARLAIDGDGDGRYDSARDPELTAGQTPILAPGQAATIFAILSAGPTGTVTITATAATGSGVPGTTFSGAGDAGGDAVTGPTGARARVTLALANTDPAAPTLTKSATVTAPDGSTRAMRGATIAYTLVASFPVAAQAARVTDPIPAGTAYAPARLLLDGVPLSDAGDGDAGDATPARISVALGDQPAGATRTIRVKVVIK